MWYIFHAMTSSGLHVAQFASDVGQWARKEFGPFETYEEANAKLATLPNPRGWNTPYVPPPPRKTDDGTRVCAVLERTYAWIRSVAGEPKPGNPVQRSLSKYLHKRDFGRRVVRKAATFS